MDIDVNKVLEQLAKGFNVAVEELYPILYKQAIIEGLISLMYLTVFIGALVLILLSIKFVNKKQNEEDEEGFPIRNHEWDWDEPRQAAFIFASAIIVVVSIFVIPVQFDSMITAFFNTEYHMIEDILKKLK